MNVCILTSRPVGRKCIEWTRANIPEGFTLVDTMNHTDIVISVLYDKILPLEYLKGLSGAFNFHPGILPEYRGAATYSWAIVNGEKEVGVTLHEMAEGIDTGDIIDIGRFPIGHTASDTFERAEGVIFDMFTRHFSTLLLGSYKKTPQDETRARTYYRRDLEKLKDITNIVRALHFPGKESCYYVTSTGERRYISYE